MEKLRRKQEHLAHVMHKSILIVCDSQQVLKELN